MLVAFNFYLDYDTDNDSSYLPSPERFANNNNLTPPVNEAHNSTSSASLERIGQSGSRRSFDVTTATDSNNPVVNELHPLDSQASGEPISIV